LKRERESANILSFRTNSSRPQFSTSVALTNNRRRDEKNAARLAMGKKMQMTCVKCENAYKKRSDESGAFACKPCSLKFSREYLVGIRKQKEVVMNVIAGGSNSNRFCVLANMSGDDTTTTGNSNSNTNNKKKKQKKKKNGNSTTANGETTTMALSDGECREILKELDEQVVFIDTASDSKEFKEFVESLREQKVIAYDCEGVKLSRTGKITLLQIAIPGKIYLIDLMKLGGEEVFVKGELRDILQSDQILKLAYDVRMDSDALFHQHNVLIKNVLDLQILDIGIRRAAGIACEYLPSLSKTVSRRLSRAEIAVCEDLKTRVKQMYTSIEDGNLWARRPLIDDARRYAALDAWVLMKLDSAMRPNGVTASHLFPGFDDSWRKRVKECSEKRLDEYREKEIPVEQGGNRTLEMINAPTF